MYTYKQRIALSHLRLWAYWFRRTPVKMPKGRGVKKSEIRIRVINKMWELGAICGQESFDEIWSMGFTEEMIEKGIYRVEQSV